MKTQIKNIIGVLSLVSYLASCSSGDDISTNLTSYDCDTEVVQTIEQGALEEGQQEDDIIYDITYPTPYEVVGSFDASQITDEQALDTYVQDAPAPTAEEEECILPEGYEVGGELNPIYPIPARCKLIIKSKVLFKEATGAISIENCNISSTETDQINIR
jgi:hypothetical protein